MKLMLFAIALVAQISAARAGSCTGELLGVTYPTDVTSLEQTENQSLRCCEERLAWAFTPLILAAYKCEFQYKYFDDEANVWRVRYLAVPRY